MVLPCILRDETSQSYETDCEKQMQYMQMQSRGKMASEVFLKSGTGLLISDPPSPK